MKHITISLADVILDIESDNQDTLNKFALFESKGDPQFSVNISKSRFNIELQELKSLVIKKEYTQSDIENNALYRDIPVLLWDKGIVIFHGVLMELFGDGYILAAPSGVGKTTHACLWKQLWGDKLTIVNGDKVFLRYELGVLWGYSTPWMGKEHYGVNKKVQIKSICFLKRNQSNSITQHNDISFLLPNFLEQTMLKNRRNYILDLIKWYKKAFSNIGLYSLNCNTEIEAAIIAYDRMSKS